jgi:hypothetical protein
VKVYFVEGAEEVCWTEVDPTVLTLIESIRYNDRRLEAADAYLNLKADAGTKAIPELVVDVIDTDDPLRDMVKEVDELFKKHEDLVKFLRHEREWVSYTVPSNDLEKAGFKARLKLIRYIFDILGEK